MSSNSGAELSDIRLNSQSWPQLWTQTSSASMRLVNHSENHTYCVQSPSGTYFLRVHRPGYQSPQAIESELAWLVALGRETTIPVPRPLAGTNGDLLQTIHIAGDPAPRFAVLFMAAEGHEVGFDDDLQNVFHTLGTYAALAHNHVQAWLAPKGFQRPIWDCDAVLNADGPWGDWRIAPGVDADMRALLQQLEQQLRLKLNAYGQGSDRFGLIHADMRLGNLLLHGKRLTVLDFDDCGMSWFGYDFAAAISFFETHPLVPRLKVEWLKGYCQYRPFSAKDVEAMDALIMLRRMALLAWIGSHGETKLAQSHVAGFAQGTANLAEAFLKGLPIS